MITLNAVLTTALTRGSGQVIARLHYTDSGGAARTPNIWEYEYDRLTARVVIPLVSGQSIERNASFTISRGLKVGASEYLVSSHTFYCSKSIQHPRENLVTILGHLLPSTPIGLTNTDRAASLVITDLLDQANITPVFDAGADIWYTWQMYPYNTPVKLASAQHILDLISRKYLSDALPRSDGIHFGHRGTWSGGDTITDYTPSLKPISQEIFSQALLISWEDTRGNRYTLGSENDPPHYLGFVDCNIKSDAFPGGAVDSADIVSLASYAYGGDEFEQRPDLSLENGDTLTPPAGSGYLGSACIELEEIYQRSASPPRWIQRVKPINNTTQTKAAALQSHAKSTVYIRQPVYITRTVYANDNPDDDQSFNTNSSASQADRMSGDAATLMQRFLPQAYNIHHFNVYNQDYAWANAPFETPQFSHSVFPSSLYVQRSNLFTKSFLWNVFDTDASAVFLFAKYFEVNINGAFGLRLDDGTDDNYVEFLHHSNVYKYEIRLSAGSVSDGTLSVISDDLIFALRLATTAWTNFKVDFLLFRPFSGPTANLLNLGRSSTLTFTPARFGFYTAGIGTFVADAIGYIDLAEPAPLPVYELIDHNHNPITDQDSTQLSGYQS